MDIIKQIDNGKKVKKRNGNPVKKRVEKTLEWAWPDRLYYGFEESMYYKNKNGSINPGYLGPFGILNPWAKRHLATAIPFKIRGSRVVNHNSSLEKGAKIHGGRQLPDPGRPCSRTPQFGALDPETQSYCELDLDDYGPYGMPGNEDGADSLQW
jgi:hypothetical protein